MLANVPESAADPDTGLPVGVAFQLKSPASGRGGAQAGFGIPLTTVVANLVQDNGKTLAVAVAQLQ